MINILRRYPLFFKFWIATIASQLASRMHSLILIWLVYKWSNSALIVGITMISASLPSVLISPFSGSLIDRHNKITLMYIADFIRMSVMFVFAYLFYIDVLSISLLIVGTIIISVSSAFFNPASMSILPQLVDEQDVTKANATGQISSSISSIIGPLFGSVLIVTLGGINAFIGAGVLFFISVTFLFGIQDTNCTKSINKTSLWEDIKSSFSLIKKYDIVYKMITKMAIVNFFFSSLVIIAPIIAKGNAQHIAYLMSSIGAGMLCSSLFFSSKELKFKASIILSFCLIIMGASFIMLAFTDSLYLQNLYIFFIGATLSAFNIVLISIYQTKLPQKNLGKIMAFIVAISLSLQPISYGIMGVLLEWMGIVYMLTLSGAVIVLSSYGVYKIKQLNN
ncbi:MAG: MFS transporter [Epsilonproteobacteria bacterium]|nr:MFS transporter [Campylobacterota bacterium]